MLSVGGLSGLMEDKTSRFTCRGKLVYQFVSTSTFTEYTVVSDICVVKVDDRAPNEVCLIGCGFATGYGAALNTAKVTPDSTCAVFGLGGVGFSVILGCKAAGATRIIGIGTHKDKYPKAIELGATECINPKDYEKPIQEVICGMTNGGVDFAFECTGRIETMNSALESTYCASGVAVVLGVTSPTDKLTFPPMLLIPGRTLKGSPFGGWVGDDLPKLVTDYLNKKINIDHLVSKRVSLDKINDAFDLIHSGKGIGGASGLMEDNTSRFTCRGKLVYQFVSTSTFTEYTVVSDICVVKVDDRAPNEVCIIGCGFATGYGAALNTAKVTPGSTCAVFGLGGVGFSVIIGCKAAGATRIIGIGTHKDKYPKAIELGATECINPKDYEKPIQEVICGMTNGGVDYAFECTGRIETMNSALESTYCASGVTVVIGVTSPTDKISFPPMLLIPGRTLKGSLFGGWIAEDLPKMVTDYLNKKINIDHLVSNTLSLDKINDAFDLLHSGTGIRTIVLF
ncbi:NADP-dependent alcohol dehydrogenase-like isoform X1 [Pseudophryne corroboree]|uniref:NADP-dependent alcohol dehydrogenase-like isoform X1 n=1 Tax=Pseudophryne corroboree TaxID=495146 RepID=UPI0030820D19